MYQFKFKTKMGNGSSLFYALKVMGQLTFAMLFEDDCLFAVSLKK